MRKASTGGFIMQYRREFNSKFISCLSYVCSSNFDVRYLLKYIYMCICLLRCAISRSLWASSPFRGSISHHCMLVTTGIVFLLGRWAVDWVLALFFSPRFLSGDWLIGPGRKNRCGSLISVLPLLPCGSNVTRSLPSFRSLLVFFECSSTSSLRWWDLVLSSEICCGRNALWTSMSSECHGL